jgi:hypothetical protein
MHREVSLAEKARALVLSTIAEKVGQTPTAVIVMVEAKEPSLPDETVRGAVWTAVNSGEAEMTKDGGLRVAAG